MCLWDVFLGGNILESLRKKSREFLPTPNSEEAFFQFIWGNLITKTSNYTHLWMINAETVYPKHRKSAKEP